MADVRRRLRGRTGDCDRGQLILVGGVVVAFALVALVLLLNTALFSENLATRGLGPDPGRADAHAAFADRSAERILRHEEAIEYGTWSAAETNTTRNIEGVDTAVRERQLQRHGSRARILVSSVRRGSALVQTDDTRNFTAGGNNTFQDDWELANTTGIRNFTMTVDASTLVNQSEPGNFTVEFEGTTWSAEVYRDSGDVVVHAGDTTCRSSAAVATINWTAGEFAGCSLPFAVDTNGDALDAPYSLRFVNGSNATGTYHLVVSDKGGNEIATDNFGGAGENPRSYPAVYAIVLDVRYEGATASYETHVRAAPGEPKETSPAS